MTTFWKSIIFELATNSFSPEAHLPESMTRASKCKDLPKAKVDELRATYNEKRKVAGSISDKLDVCMETNASDCIYVSIDDIGVKSQKEKTGGGTKERKYVENTVCHIEWDGGEHYLTAIGMENVFRMLMAFLLANGIMYNHRLVFFTDGARCIRDNICKFFDFREYHIVLDWLHLEKKTKESMSMGIKGLGKRNRKAKDDKKAIINNLLGILWTGDVGKAKE